jgi:predicted Holliday junction resolvase-like endonuclease
MIGDLVDLFQSFRTILCLCPHCGDMVRLSDLKLKHKGAAPRTWLDTYATNLRRLEKKEQLFEEKEASLRKAAIARGRARVPKMIRKCIDEAIASYNYNPYDIKALLHPVDFVVFNGLNDGEKLEDISFLSKRTSSESLNRLRTSLDSSIDGERYDWQVARVSIDGKVELE